MRGFRGGSGGGGGMGRGGRGGGGMGRTAWQATIEDKIKLNHDSYMYRLRMPETCDTTQFLPGGHFVIFGIDGQNGFYKKKYTPIQSTQEKGYFDTVIKIYRPNENPMFPQGGELTPHLEKLKIGATLQIGGPLISINYAQKGLFHVRRFKQSYDTESEQKIVPKELLFIAGGTGIAPFYSMIKEIAREATIDNTFLKGSSLTLLYGNKTVEDILLRKELDQVQQALDGYFKVVYALDKAPEGWKGEVGSINDKMIQKYAGSPKNPDNYIMYCGSKGMNSLVESVLKSIGFDPYHMLKF